MRAGYERAARACRINPAGGKLAGQIDGYCTLFFSLAEIAKYAEENQTFGKSMLNVAFRTLLAHL